MEVVGLCASIITLTELCKKVAGYIRDYRGGTEERGKLRTELLGLAGLLPALQDEITDNPENKSIQVLMGSHGPLQRIEVLLRKLSLTLCPEEGWKKHKQALTWPFKEKSEVMEHLATIERCKSWLTLALVNDHVALSEKLRADVKALHQEVHKTNENQKAQEQRQRNTENREILGWLSPLTFWATQQDTFERRQEGTGTWFLKSSVFRQWETSTVDNDKRILFCSGIPGAGKTVLVSIVINHLELALSQTSQPEDTGLAYIYCNYKQQNQTAIALTAAILRQLVSYLKEIPEDVRTSYESHINKNTRPSLDEYSIQLQKVISRFSKIFIVIDALDECSDNERDKFIRVLKMLSKSPKVNTLLTSRQITSIEKAFEDQVHQEIRAADEDIRSYLMAQINMSQNLKLLIESSKAAKSSPEGGAALIEDIACTIVGKAQGMFLLAQLHIDSVTQKATLRGVREALKVLPDDLNVVYDNAMDRIRNYQDAERRHLAILALTWITHSVRPLSVGELQHALGTEQGDTALDQDALPGESILISLCAGLVMVDGRGSKIRLVHYTTQEYFETKGSQLFPNAHKILATTCLTYLSFDVFGAGRYRTRQALTGRVQDYILFTYAAENWHTHVGVAGRESTDEVLEELTLGFLMSDANLAFSYQVRRCWQKHTRVGNRLVDTAAISNCNALSRALLVAVRCGLARELKILINRYGYAEVNARCTQGKTPLSWAAASGNREVVHFLLGLNINGTLVVDPNIRGNYGPPLVLAVCKGHADIVKLLLNHPHIEPNVLGQPECHWGYLTSLQLSVEKDNIDIAGMLLNHPRINPNLGHDHSTPLATATEKGQVDIVKLLLAHPDINPNIDAAPKTSQAPLILAVEYGHVDIVKILLNHPRIDPNIVLALKKWYDLRTTPLTMATMLMEVDIVKLLLAHPDINPNLDPDTEPNNQAALIYAAERGDVDIVEILLNHPRIDPNIEGPATPLSRATREGQVDIVKLLLAHPDINPNLDPAPDLETSEAPLILAAEQGHVDIVKILLNHPRTDPNIEGFATNNRFYCFKTTPLVTATWKRQVDIVKLLLAHPDINPNLGSAEQGHVDIYKIHLQDSSGDTPLHYAVNVEISQESINPLLVKAFLDTKHTSIDFNMKNNKQQTPLEYARSYQPETSGQSGSRDSIIALLETGIERQRMRDIANNTVNAEVQSTCTPPGVARTSSGDVKYKARE